MLLGLTITLNKLNLFHNDYLIHQSIHRLKFTENITWINLLFCQKKYKTRKTGM